jgi:hypothetical protein
MRVSENTMSMTNLLKLSFGGVAAAATATLLSGCASLASGYPVGLLYTGTQIPHAMDRNEISGPGKTGDKRGEACATGILFLAAFGDASVDAAKKIGGITEVHSVEFHNTSILGVYQQGCTEVHGK